MKSVGLYVDGPNIERGLYEAKETVILQNIGNILKEYASLNGDLVESFVFIDEDTQWREESTKISYEKMVLNSLKARPLNISMQEEDMLTEKASQTLPCTVFY